MTTLAPLGKFRALDANGNPLSGGKLYAYTAGTTTAKDTYTDVSGLFSNANPVILDASGFADIWLGTGAYKLVLKTSADVTLWTLDNFTGDTVTIAQLQNASFTYAVAGGTADAIGINPTSAIATYVAGQGFYFIALGTNTGAVTIGVSGLSSKPVTKQGATALVAGDIIAGQIVHIVYDGTQFQLVTPPSTRTTVQNFTGGVTVGNSAIAATNVLDNYLENTFTPTIRGTTTAGTGTYTSQSAQYTRVGNMVFFNISMTWTALTGAVGTLAVGGLPLTNVGRYCPIEIISTNVVAVAGAIIVGKVYPSNNYIELFDQSTGGALAGTAIDTAGTLDIAGFYFV